MGIMKGVENVARTRQTGGVSIEPGHRTPTSPESKGEHCTGWRGSGRPSSSFKRRCCCAQPEWKKGDDGGGRQQTEASQLVEFPIIVPK